MPSVKIQTQERNRNWSDHPSQFTEHRESCDFSLLLDTNATPKHDRAYVSSRVPRAEVCVVQGRVTGDNARHPFLLPLPCQRKRPEPSPGHLVATARRRSCFATQVIHQGRDQGLLRWHARGRGCRSACDIDDATAATESDWTAPERPAESRELAAAPRAVHRVPTDAVVDDAFRTDTAEEIAEAGHGVHYRPGRRPAGPDRRGVRSTLIPNLTMPRSKSWVLGPFLDHSHVKTWSQLSNTRGTTEQR